jgi:hypothetical protein
MDSSLTSLVKFFCIHLLLLAAGIMIVLHYGPIGFYPWNQSIIFDGGWRILCGQVPYRDFTAPNGIVPSAMQAVFFAWLGVTWGVYILHAALVSGLFCIVAFWLLRAFDLPALWACFYALLTAIFFYAPSGVPYIDQHAFFFSILGLACLFWSDRTERRTLSLLLLAAVPPAFLLAYLSKQLPTVLFVVFAALYLFFNRGKNVRRRALTVLGSAVLSLLVAALIFWLWGSRWDSIQLYLFELPASLGRERFQHLFYRKHVGLFFHLLELWQVAIALLVSGAAVCGYFWRSFRSGFPSRLRQAILVLFGVAVSIVSWYIWRVFSIALLQALIFYFVSSHNGFRLPPLAKRALWVSEAFIIIGLLFIGLSNMIPAIGLPWIMLSVGLVYSVWSQSDSTSRSPEAAKSNKLMWALPLVALLDAVLFNVRVNESRAALFLTRAQLDAPSASAMPGPLEAMKGPVYAGYSFTAQDLSELADYLRHPEGNFWYFGDASVIYGATGKPSVDPALWYHFGLTLPPAGSKEFLTYEQNLIANFQTYDVRRIVLEDTITKSGCELDKFTKIRQFIAANALDTTVVAGFQVIRIRARPFIIP